MAGTRDSVLNELGRASAFERAAAGPNFSMVAEAAGFLCACSTLFGWKI
jgi:hypothetical protein